MNKRDFKRRKEEFRKVDLKWLSENFSDDERNIIASIFLSERISLMEVLPEHVAWLEIEHAQLEGLETKHAELQSELLLHENFINEAEQKLKETQKAYERAKKNLEAAYEFHKILLQREQNTIEKINTSKERIVQMNTIVLLHNSATIGRVEEMRNSYFIATKADADQIREIGLNYVFDPQKATSFVEKLPNGFERRHTEEDKKSIIEYCELVINVMMQESQSRKIKLMYAEPDIAEILRLNGLKI